MQGMDGSAAGAYSPEMAKRVRKLLLKSRNCAQTSFALLQQDFALDGEQVLRALTPFPGIALRGETCGAVVGSMMALGLVYGRDDLGNNRAFLASLPAARRFCHRFEQLHGSTGCSAILAEKMGQAYNLADKVDALKYGAMGGAAVCANVVASAMALAADELRRRRPAAT